MFHELKGLGYIHTQTLGALGHKKHWTWTQGIWIPKLTQRKNWVTCSLPETWASNQVIRFQILILWKLWPEICLQNKTAWFVFTMTWTEGSYNESLRSSNHKLSYDCSLHEVIKKMISIISVSIYAFHLQILHWRDVVECAQNQYCQCTSAGYKNTWAFVAVLQEITIESDNSCPCICCS